MVQNARCIVIPNAYMKIYARTFKMSLLEDDHWEHYFHLQCRPPWTIRAFNPSRPWLGWLGYYQPEGTRSRWHGVRKIPVKMEVEKWEGATMMMTDIVQRGHSTCAVLAWLGPGCHHRPPGQLRDPYQYRLKPAIPKYWSIDLDKNNRFNCKNIWTTTQFYRPGDKWQQCCWIDYYPSL